MQINHPNPYLSTRIPVFARNVVSTSHPLAAQAGLRMLQRGYRADCAPMARFLGRQPQSLEASLFFTDSAGSPS